MKIGRSYCLPNKLVHDFDQLPVSRTSAMTMAVLRAHENDNGLVDALRRRLDRGQVMDAGPAAIRVGVKFDPTIVSKLDALSRRSSLPVEHTLRLAMEEYLFSLESNRKLTKDIDETHRDF